MKFKDKNSKHQRIANKICLMFFNLNFRTRPTAQHIFNFAKTSPSRMQIIRFLSDVKEQLKYK